MNWLRRGGLGSFLAAAILLVCIGPRAGLAETCSKEAFAMAVDEAGATLRAYNAEAAPQFSEKLRQLKARKGWKDADYERIALDYLHDARIAGLDKKANDLLAKVDELGTTDDVASLDCAKLAELKASSLELLAVMKAKSKYVIGKIDAELNPSAAKAKPPPPPVIAEADDPAARMIVPPSDTGSEDAPTRPIAGRSGAEEATGRWGSEVTAPGPSWNTTTQSDGTQSDAMSEHRSGGGRASDTAYLGPQPGREHDAVEPGQQLPPIEPSDLDFSDPDEGYTIEEIRDATQGLFGTMSTSLAAVIEHAFQQWGRPTGYVLGSEGGGALLAGLRYGKGTLYLRRGGTRTVHWHGPSLGYDFGAETSRTMFLIYRMHDPEQLFRRFAGVDGSAYLVGGAGVTMLKGGPITMAPIRTGLGLRVGANLGYVRFTREATWNPF